jgi:hypothetical protein
MCFILCHGALFELLRSNRSRKEHAKTSAATAPIRDTDPAAVGENDGLTDGQPQAVTRHVRLLRRFFAEEWFENAIAVFGGYARPFVLHSELQLAISCYSRRNANWGSCRRVFDGVLKQVGEHTLHLAGIHEHSRQVRRYFPSDGSFAEQAARAVQRAVHN